jgi:hypothetical protein
VATVAQFEGKAKRLRAQLDPALKEFLDVVVIPALVTKAYLVENGVENRLALIPNGVTHSDSRDSALGEGVP